MGLGNITPFDVYTGRHLGIIHGRGEVKSKVLQARRDCSRATRDQEQALKCPRTLSYKCPIYADDLQFGKFIDS